MQARLRSIPVRQSMHSPSVGLQGVQCLSSAALRERLQLQAALVPACPTSASAHGQADVQHEADESSSSAEDAVIVRPQPRVWRLRKLAQGRKRARRSPARSAPPGHPWRKHTPLRRRYRVGSAEALDDPAEDVHAVRDVRVAALASSWRQSTRARIKWWKRRCKCGAFPPSR